MQPEKVIKPLKKATKPETPSESASESEDPNYGTQKLDLDPSKPPFLLYMFPDVQKQAATPVLNGFYDIFYFETRMRQLVEEAIEPIYKDA